MQLVKNIFATATTLLLASAPAIADEVELTFSASQIQCGAGSPQMVIGLDVYDNGELVAEDMRINDSVIVSDIDNISMDYYIVANSMGCGLATPTELLVSEEDDIPDLPGYDSQDSIATLLSQIEDYEDLYLVELGTTNTQASYYDLQDVIITVNNEPELPGNSPAPDLGAYAD